MIEQASRDTLTCAGNYHNGIYLRLTFDTGVTGKQEVGMEENQVELSEDRQSVQKLICTDTLK